MPRAHSCNAALIVYSFTRPAADPIPELSDTTLNIGVACRLLIRKYRLRLDTVEDILGYIQHYPHVDWYWKLLDISGLVEDVAYEVTVAMHVDSDTPFDYNICITTPYSC